MCLHPFNATFNNRNIDQMYWIIKHNSKLPTQFDEVLRFAKFYLIPNVGLRNLA